MSSAPIEPVHTLSDYCVSCTSTELHAGKCPSTLTNYLLEEQGKEERDGGLSRHLKLLSFLHTPFPLSECSSLPAGHIAQYSIQKICTRISHRANNQYSIDHFSCQVVAMTGGFLAYFHFTTVPSSSAA